jgi:hypothetical protein
VAAFPPLDRLIRKEVAIGTLREIEPPQDHIGLRLIAPFMDVASDDVIFDFATGLNTGLAPARAEDAESELAQKDNLFPGVGRASVIDWAQKDYYTASDVSRFQEATLLAARLGVNDTLRLPLVLRSQVEELQAKIARDDANRRRRLDNRLEWLITTALSTAGIAYNDGKIKFTVDFGRPAGQHNQPPTGSTWNNTTADPIGDALAMNEYMYNTYGVTMNRAIASRKIINSIMNSDRFIARSGLVVGGTPSTPIDPNYVMDGWGVDAARQVFQRATGIELIRYDSVYRTRPIGSTTFTNNRFLPENTLIFLPNLQEMGALDDTSIGFAKTLTSPHPEGNWTPGYYEWEEATVDPWGRTRGTGIKAFPVFLHMDLTYSMVVLP